eukprot:TCONS_00061827-protein
MENDKNEKDQGSSQIQLSLLSYAVKHNCRFSVIQELLTHDKVWGTINDGLTLQTADGGLDVNPLILSCINQNYEVMKLLIDQGAVVDVKDASGIPLLHIACNNGLKFVKLLIKNGANPFVTCSLGNTILHEAVKVRASFNMVYFLLQCGVDINTQNSIGNTVLDLTDIEPTIKGLLQALKREKSMKKGIKTLPLKRKRSISSPQEKLKNEVQQLDKKMKTNEDNLKTSHQKLSMCEKKKVELLKDITNKQKEMNGFLMRDIENDMLLFDMPLECPSCFLDFMVGENIYQCNDGHLLCSFCNKRLKTCKKCSTRLRGIRNRAIEGIFEAVCK